jgi:hypothetical protein
MLIFWIESYLSSLQAVSGQSWKLQMVHGKPYITTFLFGARQAYSKKHMMTCSVYTIKEMEEAKKSSLTHLLSKMYSVKTVLDRLLLIGVVKQPKYQQLQINTGYRLYSLSIEEIVTTAKHFITH